MAIPPAATNLPTIKRVSSQALSLNRALEGIFLLSLRPDAELPIVAILDSSEEEHCLTVSNLSSIVFQRLMNIQDEGQVNHSPLAYLLGCYKRLHKKEIESGDQMKIDLLGCKSQIISFVVSVS